MTPDTFASAPTTPDRQFLRTSVLILAFLFTTVFCSHVVLQRAFHEGSVANELALESEDRATAARMVAATLDQFSVITSDLETRKAQTKLSWDVGRLTGKGAAPGNADAKPFSNQAKLAKSVLVTAEKILEYSRSKNPTSEEPKLLKKALENDILPRLDLAAVKNRANSDLWRQRCNFFITISLITNFTIVILLYLLLVRPTQKSIAAWVKSTKEADKKNQFRLLHDTLTGMPNHAYLHAYISRLALAAERSKTQTAVLRVDFDRFKVMQETLGSRVCDEVVRIAARRIQQALRNGDFAAYLGQDDFVVVTGELENSNAAAAIAGRIQSALMKPFAVRGGARKLSCSIGVTLMSDDEADPDLILANAAIALAEAQNEGSGLVRYFSESQRDEVERRETLYEELTHGLENGEIIAYFQPQIDLQSGKFVGFEALVRWQHPKHGLLTPAAFLDFAEQTDLTERLGEVVLTRTMEAIREWDMAGFDVPKVGVNFALAQLRNPGLIEKIKWEVERFDIEPSRLAIEVLETVLIKSDADLVVRNLKGLASAGFGIDLDDFGTGHASISNLRRFMVNRIKIDRSFVFGIETSEEQQQLTASMIAMAQALGIETLAEGVETEDAELMLRKLGCNYCQGYLIARPMAPEDTQKWLEAYRTRPYAVGEGVHS